MTDTRTFLLDAGALVAIESDPRGDVSERCIAAAKGRRLPLLPAVVFAQVWRNSSKQHVLTVIRSRCRTLPFTGNTANAVGNLSARSRTSDVVDAAVVLAAVEHDAEVITSDPGDSAHLADAMGYRIDLLAV